MKHKIYVTRVASVTYVAELDLSVEEIENRCSKYGFDDDNFYHLEWDLYNINNYDNVEAYEITHDEEKVIDGQTVMDEVTDKQWDLS